MTRRLFFTVAVLAFLAAVVAALHPASVSGQTASQAHCTMPTDIKYLPGATAPHGDQFFQCFHVFGENLKPAGVAWVEMVRSGNGFVPKEPTTFGRR